MKQQILRYWLAMNVSAGQGAVHSVKAYVAVATAHAAVDSIPVLGLHQAAAVFLLSFGQGILNYLDTHPVTIPLQINQTNETKT